MAAKSKRKSSRKPTKKKKTEQSFLQDEVIIWLTLAVSLLLMLSNFGLGGWIGDEVSYFFSGIFGLITYIIPFALFGIAAFLVSNKGNVSAYIKVAAGIVFLILACTFLELVDHKGGSLGKSIAKILTPTIGTAGTYVVIIIFMIICCVIITGKSLLQGVKTQSGKAYDKAKEDNARRRKEAELRRKEREQEKKKNTGNSEKEKKKRTDKHAVGVSFATTLTGKSPDMKEIAPEPAKEPVPEPEESPSFVINRAEPAPDVEEAEPFAEEPYEPVRESKKKSGAMAAAEMERVAAAVAADEAKPKKAYHFPPMNLLKRGNKTSGESDAHLRETAMKLQQILQNFGVSVTVTNVSCGPAVTRYELQPAAGVRVSKITGLADDIALNLAAMSVRIEAPVPGKACIGIEVPNDHRDTVSLRELIDSEEYRKAKGKLTFAVGKDIEGNIIIGDIAKMPHMLVAGTTGSGKSVFTNSIILSILYHASPDEVKLILIDPKKVEFPIYNKIPHLLIPVVTEPLKAAGALGWAVNEMNKRYLMFEANNVKNLQEFNDMVLEERNKPAEEQDEVRAKIDLLPQIVIVVDEFADLMMAARSEVEDSVLRLAQLARAAGIHMIIATQSPRADVLTGLIKSNIPSRVSLSVSSNVDSRVILDESGAEKLLGNGDLLYKPVGVKKPIRMQSGYAATSEIREVVNFLKNEHTAEYSDEVIAEVEENTPQPKDSGSAGSDNVSVNPDDDLVNQAISIIVQTNNASTAFLQRKLKLGFPRAARIMDEIEEMGIIGPQEGSKARKINITKEEWAGLQARR